MGILMFLSKGIVLVNILGPVRSKLLPLHCRKDGGGRVWRLAFGWTACLVVPTKTLGHELATVGVLVKENLSRYCGPTLVCAPMYTTLFVFSVGFFLLSANLLVGCSGWSCSLCQLPGRVGKEDHLPDATFGVRIYTIHGALTGRLSPKMRECQ